MTTTDTERYVRITLLTFEGGSWISKKILYRELDKTPGLTITSLLNSRKNSLQQKRSSGEITRAQFDILFPRSGADTDIEEWDLSLLVKIIFFLFSSSLNLQEIADLKAIISVRNDVVCHASQPQIKENDFFVYWTKVTQSIQSLAIGFGNDTRQHATDLMASLFQGPLDLQTSMDKLAQLCRNDEHMESVLASLSRLETRQNKMAAGIMSANTKLDDVLALLQGSQITCDDGQCKVEIPILGSKVCIVGKKEDVVKVAEDIVLKVLKSAVNKVDDPANDENVKTAVKDLLEDIEAKDAVAVSADLGSIILNIKCFSLQGLEYMLKWFKSSNNEIRLHGIEQTLSEMFQEQLQVVLVLPQETLDMLSAWMTELSPARDDRTFKREISMGIQCQSADAASQVLQYLHGGDSTNRLNQLSEALSEALNDKVKVEMEVDLEGFHHALKSISTTGTATEDRPSAQDEERIKTDIAGYDGPYSREAVLFSSDYIPNESLKSKQTEETRAEKETGPDRRGKLGSNWWPSLRGVVDTVGAAVGPAVGLAVGTAVGIAVGTAVQIAVGTAVGTVVGTVVGPAGGIAVGTAVMIAVGIAAGPTMGIAVEATALTAVITAVGSASGIAVGPAAWTAVMITVGIATGPAMWVSVEHTAGTTVMKAVGIAAGTAVGIAFWPAAGTKVGITVGTAVGFTVGHTVGLAVGPKVGIRVMTPVGPAAGPATGIAFGPAVGLAVGIAVGTAVGPVLGTAVGPAMGLAVGTAVGTAVGPAVGTAVGIVVGAAAWTSVMIAFGISAGAAMWIALGTAVMTAVGIAFGTAVGIAYGTAVGIAAGTAAGFAVAIAMGIAVGTAVATAMLFAKFKVQSLLA